MVREADVFLDYKSSVWAWHLVNSNKVLMTRWGWVSVPPLRDLQEEKGVAV